MNDECVLEEWLFAWPNRKKQVWFERDGNKFEFGENLKGENKLMERTSPDRTHCSFPRPRSHKHQQLTPIFLVFRAIEAINFARRNSFSQPSSMHEMRLAQILEDEAIDARQPSLFPIEPSEEALTERIRKLLRSADDGIVDISANRRQSDDPPRRGRPRRFWLKHQPGSDDSWLPLEEESRGTQTLFRLALPMLPGHRKRWCSSLVDELEASLHPTLAQEIVRQFNGPATNPRDAQLLFTTQDTNLLGTTLGAPAVRRDQVWLTEKDAEGATVLYPLTDYKPRKAENLERGYLQGRYGAIPFLGDFSVAGK